MGRKKKHVTITDQADGCVMAEMRLSGEDYSPALRQLVLRGAERSLRHFLAGRDQALWAIIKLMKQEVTMAGMKARAAEMEKVLSEPLPKE